MNETLINNLATQFPIAFAIIIVGYFYNQQLNKRDERLYTITESVVRAIENSTSVVKTLEENLKDIRETQLEIKSKI